MGAYAQLRFVHPPLFDAISQASLALHLEFDHHDLSNTAWAFSSFAIQHRPLMSAIAAAAITRIPEFSAEQLTMTAWSFETLAFVHEPLMTSIASASIPRISVFSSMEIASLASAFSTLSFSNISGASCLHGLAAAPTISKVLITRDVFEYARDAGGIPANEEHFDRWLEKTGRSEISPGRATRVTFSRGL